MDKTDLLDLREQIEKQSQSAYDQLDGWDERLFRLHRALERFGISNDLDELANEIQSAIACQERIGEQLQYHNVFYNLEDE